MTDTVTLFDLFGGVRPMARALGEAPSSVASWKRVGRVPAEKQPKVLCFAQKHGLPVTSDHVVFPNGRPLDHCNDLAAQSHHVVCERTHKTQPGGAR